MVCTRSVRIRMERVLWSSYPFNFFTGKISLFAIARPPFPYNQFNSAYLIAPKYSSLLPFVLINAYTLSPFIGMPVNAWAALTLCPIPKDLKNQSVSCLQGKYILQIRRRSDSHNAFHVSSYFQSDITKITQSISYDFSDVNMKS